MSSEDKKKLLDQLKALKIFPKNKLVRQLEKQIKNNLEKIQKEERVVIPELKQEANLVRSNKLKKYHRYLRLIRDNFPNLTYGKIRKEFSKRKQGFEAEIPDVVWQNPSP